MKQVGINMFRSCAAVKVSSWSSFVRSLVAMVFGMVVWAAPIAAHGTALRLQGNGGVTVPGSPSLNITGPYTFEAWVRSANGSDLLRKDGFDRLQYAFSASSTGMGVHANWHHNFNPGLGCYYSHAVVSGWVHVAAVFDGAVVRFYRNGVQVHSCAAQVPGSNPSIPLHIGWASTVFGTSYITGWIDELRIWRVARTEQQLRQLADNNISPAIAQGYPDLVSSWSFEGNAADARGTNDGTAFGGVSYEPAGTRPSIDCNTNGVLDAQEIQTGQVQDCNANSVPDSCDLTFGYSTDVNNNGFLDDCEPTLVSVTPSTLPAFLGGTVTVRGSNIPDGTVRLDLEGVPVNFTMTNNVGNAVIPPLGAPRSSDLTVAGSLRYGSAPGEVTGTTPAVFTWDVPEIVGAVPATGPYDGPTSVVYTLADNTVTTGIGTATFGNSAPQIAHLFSTNGVSKVVTTAPAQANPGPVSVLLRFGVESALEERGFVYLGPGLADLSVAQGWQAGGEPLTLSLVDFAPGVPVEVRLGTGVTTGTPSGFLATSTMTVTTPYTATNGVVDVELVQFAGQPNEKRVASPGAWLARAPQVVGATPASAYQGGGETVSLALAGFRPGQAVRVELGSAASGWVTLDATPSGTLDQSSVSFVMPLAPFAGQVDVVAVQDAGGASELRAVAAGAFTVVGASIASLSPVSGPLEGGTTVVVQTSGFQEGVAAQVTLGGATVAGVVAGSGASQTVTFRTVLANASGPSDVNITQGVFNAVLPGGYSFDPARIVRYCTAKLTGQGTLPVIGWTGAPSTTTGDFAITLTNALPNKTAQYFCGTSASNFPLFGGFLCAGGGVVRGPLTSTNASSAASAPFPVIAALVGTKRYFQWWFRDPLDPAGSGRGLSAGLEVEFYN